MITLIYRFGVGALAMRACARQLLCRVHGAGTGVLLGVLWLFRENRTGFTCGLDRDAVLCMAGMTGASLAERFKRTNTIASVTVVWELDKL